MAGGNHPKGGPPHKPSSSSASASASNRKSRWESSSSTTNKTNHNHNHRPNNLPPPDPKPPKPTTGPSPKQPGPTASPANPKHPPFPDPAAFGPPPPPVYGFHNLERRTIVLADATVRSYFALPPDYLDFPPPLPSHMDHSGRFLPFGSGPPGPDYWNSLGLDSRHEGPSMKRKFGEDDKGAELAKRRQQLVQLGNPNGFPAGPSSPFKAQSRSGDDPRGGKYMRTGGGFENAGFRQGGGGGGGDNVGHKYGQVDQAKLKKAFLYFAKVINENGAQKKIYIEDGKQGRLNCLACGTTGRYDCFRCEKYPLVGCFRMSSKATDRFSC